MDPLTIAAIGLGVGQSIYGMFQTSAAKRNAASNTRPIRKTQQGITDNLALAESQAGQGLTTGAKTAYVQNAERGLTSGIDAVLRSGMGVNSVGALYDNYEQGISRMALAEDQARVNNFDTYMKANYANAEDEDLNWQVNEFAPFADKAQQNAQLQQQGISNFSGGINTAFSSLSSFQQGDTNQTAGVPVRNRSTASTYERRDGGNLSTVSQPRTRTAMMAPNPMNINYTNRSLLTLNGLGMMPINGNNWDVAVGSNPAFSNNW